MATCLIEVKVKSITHTVLRSGVLWSWRKRTHFQSFVLDGDSDKLHSLAAFSMVRGWLDWTWSGETQ